MYEYGEGVEKNHEKAVEWYRKSAEQGNSDGQWRLGTMYEYGDGVEKDLEKAAVKLTKSLLKKESAFITILYGEGVTEAQAEAMVDALRLKIPDNVDISLVEGGQPVYYYIISVE
jgi:TPR repeat protein